MPDAFVLDRPAVKSLAGDGSIEDRSEGILAENTDQKWSTGVSTGPANELSKVEEIGGFNFILRWLVLRAGWPPGSQKGGQQQWTCQPHCKAKRRSPPPRGKTHRRMDPLLHF